MPTIKQRKPRKKLVVVDGVFFLAKVNSSACQLLFFYQRATHTHTHYETVLFHIVILLKHFVSYCCVMNLCNTPFVPER